MNITLRVIFTTLFIQASPYVAWAAEGGEKTGGLPQLDPTWFPGQLFWLFLTFVTLYLFFARHVLPSLSGTIENRQGYIEGDLTQARKLKNEAEKVRSAYEEMLNEAHVSSSTLFDTTAEAIKEDTNKALNNFRQKSAEDIIKTENAIQTSKKEAMDEMHTIAAEIASQAAEKIVGITTDVDQAKSVIKNMSNKKAA